MAECPKCQDGVLRLLARVGDVAVRCGSCDEYIVPRGNRHRQLADGMHDGGQKALDGLARVDDGRGPSWLNGPFPKEVEGSEEVLDPGE